MSFSSSIVKHRFTMVLFINEREIPVKILSCVAIGAFIVMLCVAVAQEHAPIPAAGKPPDKFDPSRDAGKDISDAIVEAQRSSRRILLDVGGEWCIWCRRIDTLLTTRTDIADYMQQNYVVVKVNYSKENKNEHVLSRYPKVAGYPHFFILESNGKLLHSQDTSELEKGKGHDPEKVLAFLKKWAPSR
jgi:thioredoxin-related protein